MVARKILTVVFILSGIARIAHAQPTTNLDPGRVNWAAQWLNHFAEDGLRRTGVPGMAITVVYKDQVVFLQGYGVRKVGEAAAVDPDTVFQLASVSKPITATILARLVS